MNLLDWSYIGLLVASLLGAVLFLGYTFRVRIAYPFVLVSLHMSTVVITFILFTIALVQGLDQGPFTFRTWFLILTYVVFLLTLLTGLFFFVRYDLRRKIMRLPLISTHLVMAVMTFICFTGLMGLSLQGLGARTSPSTGSASPAWYSFHRHQFIRNLTQSSRH